MKKPSARSLTLISGRTIRSAALLLALGLLVGASASPPPQASAPTFTKDIAPLLFKSCTPCHRPGEVAPFSLVTYQDTRKRAAMLVAVTQQRVMPPWKPQPGHGEFAQARHLSEAEVSLLSRWVKAGTPEGSPRDLPALPTFPMGWKLGPPDLILKAPQSFSIPAEGSDIYQHLIFSLGAPKERYLRAIEIRPGNRRVVHHAVGILDTSGKARELDAKTPEPGYRGMGGTGFLPAGFTPGYAPGQVPGWFPEDAAIVLPKGGDFVLQLHYHPSGKPETDQSEVGLYFTDKKPTRNSNILLLGSSDIDIRAGDAAYRVSDQFKLPVDVTVNNIWGHMHFIGKDMRVWAELPGGKIQRLLWINDWDFNWQDTYTYQKPIRLPAGTVVRAEFTFDNSAKNPRNPSSPPRRILIGEASTDEMAGLVIGVETSDPLSNLGLLAANFGHYLEMESKGSRANAEAEKARKKSE